MVARSERLLCDTMLGKLAVYLRMCGYDTTYALDRDAEDDDRLLELARAEDRRILTRDVSLAAQAPDAVLLTERDVTDQLRELAATGFDLTLAARPVRCGACNGSVVAVDADESVPEYAPDPSETCVWRCVDCGRHFWKGSHWDDVRARLETLRE
ncbi:MAG: Mut7-C RNAse domain-containing protein [Halobacteriota archaeon]